MKPGDQIEVTLEKFADRGKSLARLDGYVVFVDGAVPGDRVLARIHRRKKRHAEARLLDVLEPSPLRAAPRCPYFGTCGGCRWQHVRYDAQLEAKRDSVRDALERVGGFQGIDVRPTIGSENVYFYRNKMEFSFSSERWLMQDEIDSGEPLDRSFALGLHVPENFSKVLDIRACYLQSELSVRLVNAVRDLSRANGWLPWDTRSHEGYLRHLVIRQGEMTGEVMVNLVTSRFDPEPIAGMEAFFREHFPEVTTFVNTINSTFSQTAFGEEIHTIYGPGVIHDDIGPFRFEIAANAFFQTNTRQARRLYDVAAEFAAFRPEDRVYDLYCGAGTIAIYVAGAVRHVVGVELVEEAVENARMNARRNGVENTTFLSGDLMRLFTPAFVEEHGRPDVLIADPPRGGMHPKVVETIGRLHPERFVYVSCNPQTQARDLSLLAERYRIDAVQPVDLFPHTFHVENVVRLTAIN